MNLEEKLNGYEDFELAFMYRYQLETYLPETQKRIKEYLLSRGLNWSKIDKIINEISSLPYTDEDVCPRCRSKKIRSDSVEAIQTNRIEAIDGLAGIATYREERRCNVCGLWINDPNKEQGRNYRKEFKQWFMRSWLANMFNKIYYK